ncbi:hypothetical protein L204_104917 [Cryptococcus depauperatus]|nr:hypothetical protein L204_05426 [Cryptococcus depauperatus CBS 7855]
MSQDNLQSLLVPSNPSLSPHTPSASILLNGYNRPTTQLIDSKPPSISNSSLVSTSSFLDTNATTKDNASPTSSLTSISTNESFSSWPIQAHVPSLSPTAIHSGSPQHMSVNYPSPPSPVSPQSSHRKSSPKIRFAPLPVVHPEFRRRNSITLGVAARKNLISQAHNPQNNVQKLYMTDEDWDNYKKQYDAKNGNNEVVDLGQICKSGAKALWHSVKHRRSNSQSSHAPQRSTETLASPFVASTPADANYGRDSLVPNDKAQNVASPGLHTVHEDEEQHGVRSSPTESVLAGDSKESISPTPQPKMTASQTHAIHSTLVNSDIDGGNGDGDATPRRRPSPPPRVENKLPTEDELFDSASDTEDFVFESETESDNDAGKYWSQEAAEYEDKIHIDGFVTHEKERERLKAVLGFDVNRFGLTHIGEHGHASYGHGSGKGRI